MDAQFVLIGNSPTGWQLECRLAVGHALLYGLCAEFELLPHESGPDVEFLQLHADGTCMNALLCAVMPALKIGQHESGDHPDKGDRRHHFNERFGLSTDAKSTSLRTVSLSDIVTILKNIITFIVLFIISRY
jgi:hypothetical protein